MIRLTLTSLVLLVTVAPPRAQVRLLDASDRAAFVQWFTYLADAQFYRPTADVQDCAALVRHAVREALRPHSPEWVRRAQLPVVRTYPDVRARPPMADGGLALFRVSAGRDTRHGEFADARTIIALNARLVGRDPESARPGDLLYFHQPAQRTPHHVMVFVGPSVFEPQGRDWVVYHTGPFESGGAGDSAGAGEVRKVRLSDLARHPSPRWRPARNNPAFVGLYRLDWL